MLPELDDLINEEDPSTSINQDTARYLQHIERKLYSDIEARRRLDSGLLFLSCQFGSASLAWFLFSLQTSISMVMAMSMILALLPGLLDAGESFHFQLSSDRWEVSHNKPLITVGKLAIGGVIGWNSTRKIVTDSWQTEDAIKATYTEIKQAENNSFIIINQQQSLPILIALICGLFLMFLFARKSNTV
jgi:hypothetical protein